MVDDRVPVARVAPQWSLVGVAIGSVGFAASLTPTLLPRTSVTQAVASSLVAVSGYALGAIGESCVRSAARRIARRRGQSPAALRLSTGWRGGISVGLVVVAAALTPAAVGWQAEQRADLAVPGSAPTTAAVLALTAASSVALVYSGRGIRAMTRKIASSCTSKRGWHVLPANGVAVAIITAGFVAVGAIGFGIGLIVFDKMNDQQPTGQIQPTSPLRSGSSASPITWESLGVQGRWFVASGPSAAKITSVTGRPAEDPIRAYAGVDTSSDSVARAKAAVDDLIRAGGLERSHIVVYTPSTNGYVDSASAAAAEYVSDGDIASVSMQYTVLPSALSMVLNQAQSLDAGIQLLRATQAAIATLPPGSRPKLYLYGESLGAFGSMAPFDGVGIDGFAQQVDGAVWAGPPPNSAYWQQITGQATAGPAWQPVVADGSVIRFAANADGLAQPPAPWGAARGVFLQNATDPVVWWNTDLITRPPAWLDDPRGPGVPSQMRWVPYVTFIQVFVDMPSAGSLTMPAGVGHNYITSVGPAWVAVMQPKDWNAETEAKMQQVLPVPPEH